MFSLYRLIQYYIEKKKERKPGVLSSYAIGYWFSFIIYTPMLFLIGELFVYFFSDLSKQERNYSALILFVLIFSTMAFLNDRLDKKIKYDKNINIKKEKRQALVFLSVYYFILISIIWGLFKYGNW